MASLKYDVSDVETGGGGEQPQPALYVGKVVSITPRSQKSDGTKISDLEIVVDVGQEYARLWTYVKLPDDPNWSKAAHGWKLRELTDALGLPPKGSLDPKKEEGKTVKVKVIADTDQEGGYRGRIKNLFLPIDGDAAPSGEGEADEEPLTREELEGWSNDDLKGELEARNLTLAGRFSSGKAIDAILDDQGEPEAEPEEGPEPKAEETTSEAPDGISDELAADLSSDAETYAEWSDEDLKEYVTDLGIEGNIAGRKTRDKLIEAITSLAESFEKSDGGGAEATPEDDYDEWPENELLDEVNTRIEQGAEIKISGRKSKDKLIAALRADDATEPF